MKALENRKSGDKLLEVEKGISGRWEEGEREERKGMLNSCTNFLSKPCHMYY